MHDLGYGELRVTRDQQWRLSNLLQPLRNMLLAIMFEWGIALQGLHSAHHRAATDAEKTAQTRGLIRKFARQVGKDYLFFPALSPRRWRRTLTANVGQPAAQCVGVSGDLLWALCGCAARRAGPVRTGWFVESLATQTLIIFAIRTRRVPFFRSRPGLVLTLAAFCRCRRGRYAHRVTAGPPTRVHHTAVAVLHRAGPVHNRVPATRRDDEDGVLGRSDAPCRSAPPHPRPRAPHPPPRRPLQPRQPRQPHRPPARRPGPVTHGSPRILAAAAAQPAGR